MLRERSRTFGERSFTKVQETFRRRSRASLANVREPERVHARDGRDARQTFAYIGSRRTFNERHLNVHLVSLSK